MRTGRGKRKNNPSGLCKVCKTKIFNKDINAVYCKVCQEMIKWVSLRTALINFYFKKRYTSYKLKISYKVEKKQKPKGFPWPW